MNFKPMEDLCDKLTKWRIPGNAISIYKDGKEVFSYASGYEDIENKIPMNGDRLFFMYSCTKIATTLAALQLYEKGYFLLDDPLYEFIPQFRNMVYNDNEGNIKKCKENITLRHLFTMTAGFNYDVKSNAFKVAEKKTQGRFNTLETIKCLADEPLDFEPGTSWQYSLCHDVLAAVVEVISSKRFSDYINENIFLPCGGQAFFNVNEDIEDKIAVQYHYKDSEQTDAIKAQQSEVIQTDGKAVKTTKSNFLVPGSEYESGGAGIITSVFDYAKVVGAIANNGITPSGEKIISRGTIDLWRTNQLPENLLPKLIWPQFKGYGYGLGVRTMIDRAKSGSNGPIGEFGWGGAAGANALIDVENNIAFFYAHHMLVNQEAYVQPRLRNVLYGCLE